ncbi:ATP-binding protein [Zavarzinia sp. CC-PAN008]|uniref:ATP-binding protein n=1 Tax=Zavarzinia sp. CC-PAN008 TaxID=3243332 RepID=UPI003F7489A8
MTDTAATHALLERIAAALERLAPAPPRSPSLAGADAFVWHAGSPADAARGDSGRLEPVAKVSAVDLDLIVAVDRVRDILLENTRRFAAGLPANNALLWGARGMGKSSLVKAVHGAICRETPGALTLIEIHREDIASLPDLMRLLRGQDRRCLLFCDDLSFDDDDVAYKSLKAILDGGIEGRPANVLLYATSNRRHLMPREMVDNERATAINPGEAVEEKVSLSDRFGLWLGFHSCSQADYLQMVRGYAAWLALPVAEDRLRAEALEWATTRGARSGRVAWQFIQDIAGRTGTRLP